MKFRVSMPRELSWRLPEAWLLGVAVRGKGEGAWGKDLDLSADKPPTFATAEREGEIHEKELTMFPGGSGGVGPCRRAPSRSPAPAPLAARGCFLIIVIVVLLLGQPNVVVLILVAIVLLWGHRAVSLGGKHGRQG